jgi:hypothetical protein
MMTAAPMINENKISQPIVDDDPCTSIQQPEIVKLHFVVQRLTFLFACCSSESVRASACTVLADTTIEALATAL